MVTRRNFFKSLMAGLASVGAVLIAPKSVKAEPELTSEQIPESEGEYGWCMTCGPGYENTGYISEGKLFVWDEYGDIVPYEAGDDSTITLGRPVENPNVGFKYYKANWRAE